MRHDVARPDLHLHRVHPADFALLHHVAGKPVGRGRTALCARLINGAEPAAGFYQVAALLNRQADRFFAVNILAGVRGEHRGHGVPAIARGDQDGVNVRPRKQGAEIVMHGAVRIAIMRVHHFLGALQAVPAGVADRGKVNGFERQKIGQDMPGAMAHADAAKHDTVTRRHHAIPAEHRSGHQQRQGEPGGGALQKLTTIQRRNGSRFHVRVTIERIHCSSFGIILRNRTAK